MNKYHSKVRYSLAVTLETPKVDIDLYAVIETEIRSKNVIKTEIVAI